MALGLKLVIFVIIGVTVFGGNTPIKRKYGKQSPYFNQTSYGYFRRNKGSDELIRIPSIWMQDDVQKRMRIDVGARNQPGFVAEFYFFKDKTYEVYQDGNGTFKCKLVPDFNYSMEISTYGEPNYGFLGRHVLQEYNNVVADVYVGQAIDGVGPLNCLFYCDVDTCTKFLGLTCVGSANKFSFNEYWFGDNLTTTIPPDYWFTLPPECNNPQTEYFFDVHNLDGSMKSSMSMSSSKDFCSGEKSTDMPTVLYRSICCGLHTQLSNGGH